MTALPQPTDPGEAVIDAMYHGQNLVGTEIDWRLLARRRQAPPEARAWQARLASALCFAAVCVGMVAVGAALARADDPIGAVGLLLGFFGSCGIPAALFLGWRFGPRAAWSDPDELLGLACGVGILAVLIGDATVVVVDALSMGLAGVGPFAELVPGVLMFFLMGLLFFGLPALLATVPASLIWIVVYRTVVARRLRRVNTHTA